MRILHIYKDYFPVLGGIENHVRLLAQAQSARSNDVTVLVTGPTWRGSVVHDAGVRVIRAGRVATVASTPISLSLPLLLARQRPDIAHLHFPYPVGEVSQYLFGRARRTVLSYHSDVVRQKRWLRMYQPLMHRVLASVDAIIASTPNYLSSSRVLQRYADRCTVIPYGIALDRFAAPPREAVLRLKQRLGAGPWILFVGVLRYYKGLIYLLEAMADVPARLLIVGDGPLGPALRQRTAELGLGDKVAFAGAVADTDLPCFYRAADVFVLPACERSEAFGLVQVEALASGLPLVSTELGTGTSYVNVDGQTGIVVPPKDPPALARALARLVEDGALRSAMARAALQRASLFSLERMVDETEALYGKVLARPGHRGDSA